MCEYFIKNTYLFIYTYLNSSYCSYLFLQALQFLQVLKLQLVIQFLPVQLVIQFLLNIQFLTAHILVYFFILNFVYALIPTIFGYGPPLPPLATKNSFYRLMACFKTNHFQQKKIFNVTSNYYFYFESCVQNVNSL